MLVSGGVERSEAHQNRKWLMANALWSISGATRNAGSGKIVLDFSPINHRPIAINRCRVKERVPDRLSVEAKRP